MTASAASLPRFGAAPARVPAPCCDPVATASSRGVTFAPGASFSLVSAHRASGAPTHLPNPSATTTGQQG